MAQVNLTVGGRRYALACRDGEEAHLEALAAVVDDKAIQAGRAVGSANEARQLLLAALLLADELGELRSGGADPADAALARTVESLAERLEGLAARLEKTGGAS